MPNDPLLDVALDHLTKGRVAFYEAILATSSLDLCGELFEQAVDCLRRAGQQDDLPRGLLARAWCSVTEARDRNGYEAAHYSNARRDLDEAWEIAERGPMPLYLVDIHLHRARLFHAITPYPWSATFNGHPRGPKTDLAEARRLIEKHGYLRRKEELEDAEQAACDWPDATK